ncbi:MAG TPA: arginine deiminase family protein [Vicinamibacterales bacterium]|nr:arginine deiminase family protein [Vicinamibacterales bacterium]
MRATGPSARTEVGRVVEIVLKHPHEAFGSQARIEAEWRALHFAGPPDFERALDEYAAFVDLVGPMGLTLRCLSETPGTGLDSVYVRDASVVGPDGMILCAMGKPARAAEPDAQAAAFAAWGIRVAGAIAPPGLLEGGDVVWLDDETVLVGRGYRTNDAGIEQLRQLLGRAIEVVSVPLPHWRGPADVFHLMSILSPVDRDLAVVYAPLLPVPLRELLLARGLTLIEVPDAEFDSMGANVLATSPRRAVMLDGNPVTRRRLEAAGADVHVYTGREISVKGGGGPTCLTRPIRRGAV